MGVGLFGRQAELDVLGGCLDAAASGVAQVVLCGGEPGIGKTRLSEGAVTMARERGFVTAWGRSAESDGAPPCWPWRQVLRELAAGDGGKAATALGVAGELALVAPEAFPDVCVDPVDLDDDPERRFRVFDAVTRFLVDRAANAGLVVVLDDLHRADAASVLLLRHLARHPGSAPLLALATYRSTEPGLRSQLTGLLREPGTSRLDLRGLDRAAVARIVDESAGRPVSKAAVDRLHAHTGGNPFFVGELARGVAAAPEPGPSAAPNPVPGTVRDAIRDRLAALTDGCQELVRVASVLGRDFAPEVVARVVGRPLPQCLDDWDEAVSSGLVTVEPVGGHHFTHALVAEAVEADLSTVERTALHRAAALAVEALAVDLAPHLADLARHWARVADPDGPAHAAAWAHRAGDEAMFRLSYEEAARLYRQALTYHELDDRSRFAVLIALARALRQAVDLPAAFEACGQAVRIANGLNSPELCAEAAIVLEPTTVAPLDAELYSWLTHAADALDPTPTPPLASLRARVLAGLARCAVYLDDLDRATAAGAEALAIAANGNDPTASAAALRARHAVCVGADGVDERDVLADRMLELADRANSAASRILGYSWRVDVRFARGDLNGVAADLENLDWWVRQAGGPTARWHLTRYRAALAQARGAFQQAVELADEAFDAVAPLGYPAAFPVRMALLLTVDHHRGIDPVAPYVQACLTAGPGGTATPGHGFRIMDYLCPAMVLQSAGYLDAAAAKFRALGPVPTWRVPPFHQLVLYAFGIMIGVRIDERDAVAELRDLLAPFRGHHVVSGTVVEHYCGPVELYLGVAARHLGDLDAAAEDLSAAVRASQAAGAAPHLVEARTELATVLVRRGDPAGARALASQAIRDADALGMAPWRSRLARLVHDPRAAAGELTPREHEVAAAVGRGLTNRQIAVELYLSERTAQNHVQHILSKLGFTSRSQIATWIADPAHGRLRDLSTGEE
ncbi:regulatory LuxR family protein [Umezawaea tangerina]|uniref:Regulatory LuxR family protein n=1 Tax=Umezawaea tangerina TaxID=84725 RepID=A0A2T0T485_9PSEU|nr:regulatory LuxR family protein [Umezawaea tangerina]